MRSSSAPAPSAPRRLLMLSGVGPADHLREPRQSRWCMTAPGVGQNLRDHPVVLCHLEDEAGILNWTAYAPRNQTYACGTPPTGSDLRNDMIMIGIE